MSYFTSPAHTVCKLPWPAYTMHGDEMPLWVVLYPGYPDGVSGYFTSEIGARYEAARLNQLAGGPLPASELWRYWDEFRGLSMICGS